MINKIEYDQLKEAKADGYEWVARDEDGWVYVYKTKPKKLVVVGSMITSTEFSRAMVQHLKF